MKYIFQGIKDYLHDVKHDRLCLYIHRVYHQEVCDDIGNYTIQYRGSPDWKEGNLWHYIRQRKIARKAHK